jgi:hypothetical protein
VVARANAGSPSVALRATKFLKATHLCCDFVKDAWLSCWHVIDFNGGHNASDR